MAEDRRHCSVHEDYIKSISTLSGSIQNLNTHVDWLMRIGKWVAGTALTIALFIAAGMATFAYKSAEVYAKVETQTAQIATLQNTVDDIARRQH